MAWPLRAGAVATTLRFLAYLSAVHDPEFWTYNQDLPDGFLPKLLDRERLFQETEELVGLGANWPVVSHRDGIIVRSRFVERYDQNVFMVEATLPATPEKLRDVFWKDSPGIPEWNPTVDTVEVVKHFDDRTWVSWQTTKPRVGGLISPRDLVSLSFWRRIPVPLVDPSSVPEDQRYVYEIACTNATWPTKPPSSRFVRGTVGPGIMVFNPIPGRRPGETYSRLSWIFSADMDFASFIPTRIVNRVLPSTLHDYVRSLRSHVLKKGPSVILTNYL